MEDKISNYVNGFRKLHGFRKFNQHTLVIREMKTSY